MNPDNRVTHAIIGMAGRWWWAKNQQTLRSCNKVINEAVNIKTITRTRKDTYCEAINNATSLINERISREPI